MLAGPGHVAGTQELAVTPDPDQREAGLGAGAGGPQTASSCQARVPVTVGLTVGRCCGGQIHFVPAPQRKEQSQEC